MGHHDPRRRRDKGAPQTIQCLQICTVSLTVADNERSQSEVLYADSLHNPHDRGPRVGCVLMAPRHHDSRRRRRQDPKDCCNICPGRRAHGHVAAPKGCRGDLKPKASRSNPYDVFDDVWLVR